MFSFSNIADYHRQLHSRTTSCTEAVLHYSQRIREQVSLNALLYHYEEEALQRARELDARREQGQPMGKLHGVVVTLKDVISYRHHPLGAASRILDGFTAQYHATAVERLLAEEAIIIGSNNCDEFAMGSSNENSAYGPVRNAADPNRVPGGSSGGSAVAVQAGLCMVSLGSDTGGSVRQPADFCGVVGLKPTYGRVSRHGLIAYGSSFDQIGVLSLSTEDAALVLEVIAGADDYDATVSPEPVPAYSQLPGSSAAKPVVGYFRQALEHPSLDPETGTRIREQLQQLRADGYTVVELDFALMDYIVPTYYVLTTAEASSNLSRYDGVRYGRQQEPVPGDLTEFYAANRSYGFGPEVQRRILLGTFVLSAGYFDAYYTKAQQVRRKLLDDTNLIFKEIDILLSPVSPGTAFRIGEKTNDPLEMYLADIYTVFANLVGIPALALPLYRHSNGLPFGLQLHARHFDEVSLLQLGSDWMQRYRHVQA
ncbi:MAG TPA: Asp-tRNA(Asn)/Glu-tRNA(Gln) amidotransferase subunit GatA [Lacibacter sp.]|nr:Asp-tRNA(Asn)/Glu-tRNA(Gln) amidotransferase subunit GatA [Lacibacter sp.]HMO87892.1 Asp-tRNA(Asn)/Glu-tRNA(Gln) amidotransferase subunit GatA [Lacibacter sp.]